MKSRLLCELIFVATFILLLFSGAGATTLTTPGPTVSSLTTDDYGVMTGLTVGTGGNLISWLDYASSWFELNGGNPLEVSSANVTLWDGTPAAPVASGFFIPNRFQDWSYDVLSTNVWHNVLEYHAPGIDMIGSIGYKLVDPSAVFGAGYVDMMVATQFTNVGNGPVTIKPFAYRRVNPGASTTEYYSNHGGNIWDYDGTDGTSDDFAVAWRPDGKWFYIWSGFPITRYRIQGYTNPTLYSSLLGGGANYDITNSTAMVSGVTPEVGFQYQPVTLNPGEASLYWLFPKVIKVNNTAVSNPSDIDWQSKDIGAAQFNTNQLFANTDVSINYSAMTFRNSNASTVTAVEITGGMVASPLNAPLTNASGIRYWEIFYDTRRATSTASITFTYDPVADCINDENSLELAYRTDYSQNWTKYANIVRNTAANTITATGVTVGDCQWVLASTGNNPLPVEVSTFDPSVTTTALFQNFGNPFNSDTWIPFQLAARSDVVIRIYDIRGQMVKELALGNRGGGAYNDAGRAAYWNGRNEKGEKAASGIYWYTMKTSAADGSESISPPRKMIVLK